MPDLYSSCLLAGLDLDGGRDVSGYELHGDTRATRQVQWRKQTVDNQWVEGSYDTQAVRGNIVEAVVVWVYGVDHSDFERKAQAVVDAVASPSFTMTWKSGGTTAAEAVTEVWNCTFSDYTIETQREYQQANVGIVRLAINRRPKVTRTYADSTTYVG